MRFPLLFSILITSVTISAQTRFDVSSGLEFNTAQDQASPGDSIVWESGTYIDTRMDINKDGIIVTAEPYGTVLFTGVSRTVINGDDITFSGFQYIGGFIANLDVIRVYGSDVVITHVNIQNYTSHKYLVVDEVCRRNTISYCNFENRLNQDDKNILSILVDNEPGFHTIRYCSFKNFDGIGNDQGIEPIRIGVSSQGDLDSRTLVEYCYFTQCNGDGEIISHKSRQNVYRYNTFENNPRAELVLRHGDEGIVYGNFFLNNMGGIRVREGSNHFIYNNYFEGLDRRSIYLQNDPSDPLTDIHIYHNTFINSEEIILGGSGNNPPTDVYIANNIFSDPQEQLFIHDTGNETWLGNLSFGNLGIDGPSVGLSETDPLLYENAEGFYQPEVNSPVISSSGDVYPMVPLYPGMVYDNEITLDLMQESRSSLLTDRAIGASEYSATVIVQPHVNEFNTGPSYLFDNLVDYLTANTAQLYVGGESENRPIVISSNIAWTVTSNDDWINTNLLSGTGDSPLEIIIDANQDNMNRSGSLTITGGTQSVSVNIFQDAGQPVGILEYLKNDMLIFPNPTNNSIKLSNLPDEYKSTQIELINQDGKIVATRVYQIDDQKLLIDLEDLLPGTYFINIKFLSPNGRIYDELTRKIGKI